MSSRCPSLNPGRAGPGHSLARRLCSWHCPEQQKQNKADGGADGDMTKIAVWNTAFLGDAILTLPLLQTLHAACPEATIDFWVRKGFGSLFTAHPAISRVWEYDKQGGEKGLLQAARLGRVLGRERYSLWISAHTSVRSGFMARWSSAKLRIGYDRPLPNMWLYTHVVPRRFEDLEEIERLNQLLLPLDLAARGISPSTWPELLLPQGALSAAGEFFATLGRGPVLGVHPGSTWATKRWPQGYFADIAARAAREGAQVLVFGGPGEDDMADAVMAEAGAKLGGTERHRLTNLAGRLSLPELGAYIGRLSAYVTNDSGPMHLAWPQGVPVIALFGPTVRSLGFFPRGEKAQVMELPLECRPCGLHGPRQCPLGHHDCMRGMTPQMVWPHVADILWGNRKNTGFCC